MREAYAQLHPELLFDSPAVGDQVFPGIGALWLTDLLPEALSVVPWVDDPSVAEAVVFPGLRVEGAPLGEGVLLAEAQFGFLDDVGHIQHAGLVLRRRRKPLYEVVAPAGGEFRRCTGLNLADVDVVHDDVDPVILPPVLGEGVEPLFVVPWHEVGPLKDFQALLPCQRPAGDDHRRGSAYHQPGADGS